MDDLLGVDLNSGMLEAISNPPPGFKSKHTFVESDIPARLRAIAWFSRCGEPLQLDLTMSIQQVRTWTQAMRSCKSLTWENAELEAQNQLTLFLHLHDKVMYRNWNRIVDTFKQTVVEPLVEQEIRPFKEQHGLDIVFVHCVTWDILGALMENAYMGSNHCAFFFLELLMVYEAGHFPCGWRGKWPQGQLVVY